MVSWSIITRWCIDAKITKKSRPDELMHPIEIFLNNIDIIMIVIRGKLIYFVDVN